MIKYLRETLTIHNDSAFAFNSDTLELVEDKVNRDKDYTNTQALMVRTNPFGIYGGEHIFDAIVSGKTWVKSKTLPFYVRVIQPLLYKDYIVEAWWDGRLYKFQKTWGDKNVYINDKYFRWEKGHGEIACLGIFKNNLYFWLSGIVEPQRLASRFGKKCPEPTDFVLVGDYFESDDILGKLNVECDYTYPIIVTKSGIQIGETKMSFLAHASKSVTLASNMKHINKEYFTSDMLCVLRSLLPEEFTILMVDSLHSFKRHHLSDYSVTTLMGKTGYYLHNSDENRVVFTINGTVYGICYKDILDKTGSYMRKYDITPSSVVICTSSTGVYFTINNIVCKIDGNSLYDMNTGEQVYTGCISDITIEALKRQYILG